MRALLVFLSLNLYSGLWACAEYRLFRLNLLDANNEVVSEIISRLDPNQYATYHPIPADQRIVYTQTWMCKGDTSHAPPCPAPELPQALPESNSNPPQ